MSHVHFHLTMDGEYFPDPVGEQVDDLAAAHARAISLGQCVMSFCELDGQPSRTERGVVTIADATGHVLMSVIVRHDRTARDVRRHAARRAEQRKITSARLRGR